MKYQINQGGFPVGQYLIPAMTVIDSASNDDWSKLARGHTIPINATPLDDEAVKALAAEKVRAGYR
jgi:hypothetical protein